MQPDPHSQDIRDRPTPPFSGTLPEEQDTGTPPPSDEWPPGPARAAEIAREQGKLDLELARISVAGARSSLRIDRAAARKAEHEANKEKAIAAQESAKARKLEAEALAALNVAQSIPAEKRQTRAGGWVRISFSVIAFGLAVAFLILGAAHEQLWPFLPAAVSGSCLYPLKPWQFLPSAKKTEAEEIGGSP